MMIVSLRMLRRIDQAEELEAADGAAGGRLICRWRLHLPIPGLHHRYTSDSKFIDRTIQPVANQNGSHSLHADVPVS
jgi:hypothetical protein